MGAELGEFYSHSLLHSCFLFLLCLLFLLLVREAMPFPFSAVRGCVSFCCGCGGLFVLLWVRAKHPQQKKRNTLPPPEAAEALCKHPYEAPTLSQP